MALDQEMVDSMRAGQRAGAADREVALRDGHMPADEHQLPVEGAARDMWLTGYSMGIIAADGSWGGDDAT